MRRLVSILVLSAVTSACVPGEMGDTFDFALDWADSDDPALQAASLAAEEVRREREARETFSQARDDMDPAGFADAAALRPLEPRYSIYAAVLLAERERSEESFQHNQRAIHTLKLLHPDADSAEIQRRWAEMYIEATRDLIVNGGRASLSETYCAMLVDQYPSVFGGSADGALFLATADYAPCA